MKNQKIPFGLNTNSNQIVRAADVPNGRACGCICPGCESPLVAANKGKKQAAHFRHAAKADCANGYESAVHLAAKQVLLKHKRVLVPEFKTIIKGQRIQIAEEEVVADSVDIEFLLGNVRPDILFHVGSLELHVVIYVTHGIDDIKQQKLNEMDASCIEIDLSYVDFDGLIDEREFEKFVISDPGNRRWVRCAKGEALTRAAERRYEELKLQRVAAEEQRRLDAQLAEQKRLSDALEAEELRGVAEKAAKEKNLTAKLSLDELSDQVLHHFESADIRQANVVKYEPTKDWPSLPWKSYVQTKLIRRDKILETYSSLLSRGQNLAKECQACFMLSSVDQQNKCESCHGEVFLAIEVSRQRANGVRSGQLLAVEKSIRLVPALVGEDLKHVLISPPPAKQ